MRALALGALLLLGCGNPPDPCAHCKSRRLPCIVDKVTQIGECVLPQKLSGCPMGSCDDQQE